MKPEKKQFLNGILHKGIIVLTGLTLIFCIYMNNVLGIADSRHYADKIIRTFIESISALQNYDAAEENYLPVIAVYDMYEGVSVCLVHISESDTPSQHNYTAEVKRMADSDFWESYTMHEAYDELLYNVFNPVCIGISFSYDNFVGYWQRIGPPEGGQATIAWISCNVEHIRSAQSLYKEANRNLLLLSFMYFGVISTFVYNKSFRKAEGHG